MNMAEQINDTLDAHEDTVRQQFDQLSEDQLAAIGDALDNASASAERMITILDSTHERVERTLRKYESQGWAACVGKKFPTISSGTMISLVPENEV